MYKCNEQGCPMQPNHFIFLVNYFIIFKFDFKIRQTLSYYESKSHRSKLKPKLNSPAGQNATD